MCRHITTDHSEPLDQSVYLLLASVTLTTLCRFFPVNNCSPWVAKLHPASWGYMSPSLVGHAPQPPHTMQVAAESVVPGLTGLDLGSVMNFSQKSTQVLFLTLMRQCFLWIKPVFTTFGSYLLMDKMSVLFLKLT